MKINTSKSLMGIFSKSDIVRYLNSESNAHHYFAALAAMDQEWEPQQPSSTATSIPMLLAELGFSPKRTGFRYLVDAITYFMDCPNASITKEIYPNVAKNHHVSPAGIERSIRSSIENAWNYGNAALRQEVFPQFAVVSDKKPTNGDFIHGAALYYQRMTEDKTQQSTTNPAF